MSDVGLQCFVEIHVKGIERRLIETSYTNDMIIYTNIIKWKTVCLFVGNKETLILVHIALSNRIFTFIPV